MTQIRAPFLCIIILTLLAGTPAFAENQTNPQSTTKSTATLSTTGEDLSNWTRKQWAAAKAKWAKEKMKWTDCQRQGSKKKLSGRKSWSFLYDCMTK
jgi:hypothetical protein